MDLQLQGRTFLVTGGSRGIGKALVLALLQEGANVATCAREQNGLARLYENIPVALKKYLAAYVCDVRDETMMSRVVTATYNRFGRLDGVVANAGIGAPGNVLETTQESWFEQYEIKMFGALNAIKPAIPMMLQSDSPRVVVINGVTANVPDKDMAAVSAARAAVKQVAHMLAQELAPSICVNTINIGVIDTDRQQAKYQAAGAVLPYAQWKEQEAHSRGIPMGRFGTPAEVTPAALLLLSPLSSYMTGGCIDVAGGLAMQ